MSEAKLEQLVRAPRGAVFDAFVYPAIITKFWLDSTTDPLAPEAKVEWAFMVPGASETVQVTGFTQNQRIAFAWSDGVSVSLEFSDLEEGTRLAVTLVGLENTSEAVNAAEGFSIALCDLKTLLESGRSANLVRDKAALIALS